MMLNEALSVGDLLNKGTTFEINSAFNEVDEEFSDDIFTDFEETQKILIKSPWEKSFDELKEMMTENFNGIYKKIVKEGFGEIVPTEKVRVTIHYNAFWENEVESFDSTHLRNKPHVFTVGKQEILIGLEKSVLSMKKGEESQFLIPYTLLFGELGCFPRIKPKADGLFIITLIDYTLLGDSEALDNIDIEKSNEFSAIIKNVKDTKLSAVDHFKQARYKNAVKAYHKAVKSLEFCNVKDENEEIEQKKLLIQLYTSLAVCYNKLNMPTKVCCICNELSRISNIRTNSKALFHEGRALLSLGDFTKSKEKLQLALKLEPNNKEIIRELKMLEEKSIKYNDETREICRKAFGCIQLAEKKNLIQNVSDELKNVIKYMFEQITKEDQDFFTIPEGYTKEEIEYIKQEADKYNMYVHEANKHNQVEYIIKKKSKSN